MRWSASVQFPRAIQEIAITMRLTLHPRYQRLKTKQRRNYTRILQTGKVHRIRESPSFPKKSIVYTRPTWTDSSWVKAPLHDTIRPHGACRLPCTWVNRNVWHVARMPGHVKIGWKGITARSVFEPILPRELCDYPIRAQQTPKTTFTLCDYERETGSRVTMHLHAPILLRNIFVSVNMEFFCRINNKPRNGLPVMLDCSQYGTSRFKNCRRCHSLCV